MTLTYDDTQKLETALSHLCGGLKGLGLYPPGHPALLAPISKAHQLLQGVLKVSDPAGFGIVDDTLVVEERAFYEASAPVGEITARLVEREIGGLVVRRGVTLNEVL